MSQRRKRVTFEIVNPYNCHGYQDKIRQLLDNDLVGFDPSRPHVIVSTNQDPETVRSTLKYITNSEVILLGGFSPLNQPSPALQNPLHGYQQTTLASTSNQAATQLALPNPQQQVHVDKVYIGRQTNIIHNHYYNHEPTTPNPPPGSRQWQQALIPGTPPTNHHAHTKVIKRDNISIYHCSGCQELGKGDRYICQHCPYVHHLNCIDYKERATHKFFNGSTFKFHQNRFDTDDRICDACGLHINQLFYHCERKNLDLHPFCLNLQEEVYPDDEGTKYKLCKTMKSKCLRCFSKENNQKDGFWCYYSSKKRNLQCHVSCMMEAFLNK